MYSTSAPFPKEAIGDDVTPMLPASDPEPIVPSATLCARKVPVFPDFAPVPRPGVTGQPYIRLLTRVNGLVQDLPPGFVLDQCVTGAGSVGLAAGATPAVQSSVAIPNQQIGAEDAPLLAQPTNGFKTITVDGVSVLVPDFSADV